LQLIVGRFEVSERRVEVPFRHFADGGGVRHHRVLARQVAARLLGRERLHLARQRQVAVEHRREVRQHRREAALLDTGIVEHRLQPLPVARQVELPHARPAARVVDELGVAAALRQPFAEWPQALRVAGEAGRLHQVQVRVAEVGADRQRRVELALALVEAAGQHQQLAQRVVRVGLVGRDVAIGAETVLGLVEAAERHRQVAHLVLGVDPVGIELEQPLEAALGVVPTARLPPEVGLRGQRVGIARVPLEVVVEDRLDDYLERHPRDPYALAAQADLWWEARRWDDAERGFQRLLELDPNWVDAQNKMGYLSMALGRFDEAEDRFRTYRYVAPDQANPHDSLGELLVLTGRFDEGERELDAALAIRPDFCNSYLNLMEAARLTGHPERLRPLGERLAKSGCNAELVDNTRCWTRMWELYLARDWKGLEAVFNDPCIQERGFAPVLPHLAAVLDGDLPLARKMEAFAAKQASRYLTRENPVVPHTAAIREVAEGNLDAALAHFKATDDQLQYRVINDGLFKMYNRLQWAHALELEGDHAGAEKLVREVAAVNR